MEDCFDGSSIKELLLGSEMSRELIFALGRAGDVQYFANFARPFFKVRVPGLYDLKGIKGNRTMRVHLKCPKEYALDDFMKLLKNISTQ